MQDYSGIRIENPMMIEFSNNYIIGLPSRQPDPAFVELVAVGGSESVSITGMRFTGNVFRAAGATASAGVLHAFKLNETAGAFDRQGITNTLVEGNAFNAVKGAATRLQTSMWLRGSGLSSGTWKFDLCDELLFGNRSTIPADELMSSRTGNEAYVDDIFAHLQTSLRYQNMVGFNPSQGPQLSGQITHITHVEGCVVTVQMSSGQSSRPAVVYLSADQSRDDLGCHGKGCHPHEGVSRVF